MADPDANSTFHERLSNARARIAAAARLAGRDPERVRLIAVSKTFPAAAIQEAIAAGQREFGENRVQEALGKWPDLRAAAPDIRVRLIGALQTNKVRQAFEVFDAIDTIDRPKLARAVAEEAVRAGGCPDLHIQVNIGEEPQKSGIPPQESDAFVRLCRDEFGLPIKGVMGIPPKDAPPAPFFALLAAIADRNGLAEINMGMSGDFEQAVGLGATHVRLGEALFGPRG